MVKEPSLSSYFVRLADFESDSGSMFISYISQAVYLCKLRKQAYTLRNGVGFSSNQAIFLFHEDGDTKASLYGDWLKKENSTLMVKDHPCNQKGI